MAYKRSYKLSELASFVERSLSRFGQGVGQDEVNGERTSLYEATGLAKRLLSYLAKKCGILLMSYLFASSDALFDTYPFGIALLCAASKDVFFIYIGLLISALTQKRDAAAYFCIYTACVIMRIAFSSKLFTGDRKDHGKSGKVRSNALASQMFNEPFALRLLCVIACSFSVSLARLIADGFLYYDLFGMLACLFISPLLFCAYYYPSAKGLTSPQIRGICGAVFVFSLVYSLRLYYIFGYSASFAAALLITLYVARKLGAPKGSICGLFAGLACGVQTSPMLAVAGLVFGCICTRSLFLAAGGSMLTCLLFGIASDGVSAFGGLLPELAIAHSIFLPLSYYGLLPDAEKLLPDGAVRARELGEAVISEGRLRDSTEQLRAVSASFGELSETIAALSDRLRRPDVLDLRAICEECFHKHCAKCSLAGVCYGRDYGMTSELIGKLASALDKKGRIDMSDIPSYVGERCFNILKMISDINLAYSKHIEELIKNDGIAAFAVDYKAVSKLISEACSLSDEEYELETELSKKLMRALKYMDIDAECVYVYGKRKRHITVAGVDASQLRLSSSQLRQALENLCGVMLTPPVFELDGARMSLTCESARAFKVTYFRSSTKLEESDANGDTALAFESRDDRFCMLISDGMGSGKEAAMTSRLCAVFLSKMLYAGCAKPVVLELLNGFIRGKSGECSSTVDLCELDLILGKGSFIKSGAAPSYILRDGDLYKLQSKTLPIGILRECDAEQIEFELHDKDVIVMFSDGVAASLDEGTWLASLLCFEFDDDLEKMTNKILERASRENARGDDMTVALIRIECEKREI